MFTQEVWWKEILATKPLKLTADWAETCWSRLSYQDNYDRLTNCCCLVKPCPQIHTHTYTLACPHTVTTRRRLACPLTYHTNTYSTFRPSCPWKRANDCLTEDTMLLRHTFSHIHTHHTQWGLGRWLALGMELPPGFMSECCLQPIKQPGSYPSNPLHRPAMLPDLALHSNLCGV